MIKIADEVGVEEPEQEPFRSSAKRKPVRQNDKELLLFIFAARRY